MNCPNCKNPIQENSSSCEWCGVPLSVNNSNTANAVNSTDKPNLIKLLGVDNHKTLWGMRHAMITFSFDEKIPNIKGNRRVILKYQHNGLSGLIRMFNFNYETKNANNIIIQAYFKPFDDESKKLFPLSQFATVEPYSI
jgi:hypothetical protein